MNNKLQKFKNSGYELFEDQISQIKGGFWRDTPLIPALTSVAVGLGVRYYSSNKIGVMATGTVLTLAVGSYYLGKNSSSTRANLSDKQQEEIK